MLNGFLGFLVCKAHPDASCKTGGVVTGLFPLDSVLCHLETYSPQSKYICCMYVFKFWELSDGGTRWDVQNSVWGLSLSVSPVISA